jgi:hypothetical protein
MFCASRSARWIGSRLIPIGFSLLFAVLTTGFSMYFAEYLLITACGSGLVLIAARGAFVQGGELLPKRWMVRTVARLLLATGWAIAIAICFGLLSSLLGMLFPMPAPTRGHYYLMLDDGRIANVSFEGGEVTDSDGKPIAMSQSELNRHGVGSGDLRLTGMRPQDMDFGPRVDSFGFHSESAHLRRFNLYGDRNYSWFYVVSRNSIEGYDSHTNNPIGSMGQNGWAASPQSFPAPLNSLGYWYFTNAPAEHVIVASDRNVWKIDFESRRVTRKFTADPGDMVLDAGNYFQSRIGDEQGSPAATMVATRQAIYLIRDGKAPLRIPQAYHAPQYDSVSIGKTIDGRWMLNYEPDSSAKNTVPRRVVFFSADGNLLQEVAMQPLSTYMQDESPSDLVCEAFATPPGLLFGLMSFKAWDLKSGTPILWTFSLTVGCLCCAMSIRLARRRLYSCAAIGGWAALNLLLGIPGVLLLLSVDDAVPTDRCESCGKPRPITLEKCPLCAADFASPPKTGIEIFAAA